MNSGVLAAVVAALALVVAGLVAALSAQKVENMRVRSGLLEKAQERKLAAIEAFLLAVTSWVDQLAVIDDFRTQPDLPQEAVDEYNRRQKAKDETYRHLLLLANEPLYKWLAGTYNRAEVHFKETYVEQVTRPQEPNAEAKKQWRQFRKLLREDLIQQLRPELADLREPLPLSSTWRGLRGRTTREGNTGQNLSAGDQEPRDPGGLS